MNPCGTRTVASTIIRDLAFAAQSKIPAVTADAHGAETPPGPLFTFEAGSYTAMLDGSVPQEILDVYGEPAVGPVQLELTESTATLTYETLDGEAVEVTLQLGALGTADIPL